MAPPLPLPGKVDDDIPGSEGATNEAPSRKVSDLQGAMQ
jgi:hypothetical protein